MLGQQAQPRLRCYVVGHERSALGIAVVLTRLLPFVAIYLLAGEMPRADVPFFYYKATNALAGRLVYVDFRSFHAPLFSYMLAIPLLFWHDPRAIVLLMVLVEGLTVWLTYRYFHNRNPEKAIWSALLYLLLPAPIAMCLLGGQEDVWLWLVGLLAVLAYMSGNKNLGSLTPSPATGTCRMGLVLAAGLLILKVTFILIVFPLVWLVRDKARLIGALLLVGVPTLIGLYVLTGWKFLMPIQHSDLAFSPNLPSVLRPWLFGLLNHMPLKTLNVIGMLATVSTLTFTGIRYRRLAIRDAMPALWVVTFGMFQLFQVSAMAYYVFIFLMPFVFELVSINNRWQVALLILLNWLVVAQPYVTIVNNQPLFTSPGVIGQGYNWLVYLLDISTALALGWMVWLAVRRLEALNAGRLENLISQHPLDQASPIQVMRKLD